MIEVFALEPKSDRLVQQAFELGMGFGEARPPAVHDAHVLNAQRIALSMLENLATYDRPVVAAGYVRDRLNAIVAELREVTK